MLQRECFHAFDVDWLDLNSLSQDRAGVQAPTDPTLLDMLVTDNMNYKPQSDH